MKKNDILLLLISASAMVFAWIGFSIYHNLATSTVSPVVGQQIAPIPASFDTKTLNKLSERKKVSPDLSAIETVASPTAAPITPSPLPTLIVTPTISTTSAQTATGGAVTP